MKRLLLLTNAVWLYFLCISCQNSQQIELEKVADRKDTIKENPVATDTLRVSIQTSPSRNIGTNQETKKDTIKKSGKTGKTHVIIHKSPEQEKIDSIKSAKTKSKNSP